MTSKVISVLFHEAQAKEWDLGSQSHVRIMKDTGIPFKLISTENRRVFTSCVIHPDLKGIITTWISLTLGGRLIVGITDSIESRLYVFEGYHRHSFKSEGGFTTPSDVVDLLFKALLEGNTSVKVSLYNKMVNSFIDYFAERREPRVYEFTGEYKGHSFVGKLVWGIRGNWCEALVESSLVPWWSGIENLGTHPFVKLHRKSLRIKR
jgi:hypothetical protein